MSEKFSIWKKHFENQARGLIPRDNSFYKVSTESTNQTSGNNESKINLISPSQQIVERAKKQIRYPDAIYDPVTGIMLHSKGKPHSVRRSTKKISKIKKAKTGRKKTIKPSKKSKKCQNRKKKNCKSKKNGRKK